MLKVRAGAYSIELANPRHEHEWRLWETLKLPKGTVLIPGVISHATNIVEHPELVAERIMRLARLVGRENVIAGTDCGFAQVTYLRACIRRSCGRSCEALVDGARLASKELWGKGAKRPGLKRATRVASQTCGHEAAGDEGVGEASDQARCREIAAVRGRRHVVEYAAAITIDLTPA